MAVFAADQTTPSTSQLESKFEIWNAYSIDHPNAILVVNNISVVVLAEV